MTTRFGRYVELLALLVFVVALLCAVSGKEEDLDGQLYCDMVHRHQQDRSTGWPDYRGIYRQQCVNGKLR